MEITKSITPFQEKKASAINSLEITETINNIKSTETVTPTEEMQWEEKDKIQSQGTTLDDYINDSLLYQWYGNKRSWHLY